MKKTFFKQIYSRTKILILFNTIVIIYLFFTYIPKRNTDSFSTSFLLKADIDVISEIIVTVPALPRPSAFNELHLIKKNNGFTYKTGTGEYIIDGALINRLFEVFTKKQIFTFITEDILQYKNFGLDKNNAVKMQFIREDKSIAGEFIFGEKDILGTNIYLLLDGRTKIFKTIDTVSSFLTVRSDFWIDLQIYKFLFDGNKIQSVEKNHTHIIRSKENEPYFSDLELFLKRFSCVDIFPAPVLTSLQTEYLSIILGSGERLTIGETPMENGDYILFDSKLKNAYVISGYTKRKIDSAVDIILYGKAEEK